MSAAVVLGPGWPVRGVPLTPAHPQAGHERKMDCEEAASPGKCLQGQKPKTSGAEPGIDEEKKLTSPCGAHSTGSVAAWDV